jgi:hypothetical protein
MPRKWYPGPPHVSRYQPLVDYLVADRPDFAGGTVTFRRVGR